MVSVVVSVAAAAAAGLAAVVAVAVGPGPSCFGGSVLEVVAGQHLEVTRSLETKTISYSIYILSPIGLDTACMVMQLMVVN